MDATCYVAIPFGRKTDFMTGRVIDFDWTYTNVIRPAVEEAGLKCVRADEVVHSGSLEELTFSLILTSDVMIADLTTNNPNVLYELGVRHAVRPRGTLLLHEDRQQLPFSLGRLGPSSMISYKSLGDSLYYQEALSLRKVISEAVRAMVGSPAGEPDSPVYALMRGLKPPAVPEGIFQLSAATPTQDADQHVNELKRLRDESSWDALVQKAEGYPEEVRSVPEVAQLLALALNRRGQSGDPERAVDVINQLIERTGGDSETYGILGRIYKDGYERNKAAGDSEAAARDLEAAIESYRKGFEKQPDDYYPGVNVVTLLLQRNDDEAKRELRLILPRVLDAVIKKLNASPPGSPGFWEVATALHLAAVSRDWELAEGFLKMLLTSSTPQWMVETTVRDLTLLEPSMEARADEERLRGIVSRLRSASPSGEGRYA